MTRKRKYEKDIIAQGELAGANKWSKKYMEKIPQMYSEGKSLPAIAKELGIVTSTIYAWKDKHPELKRRLAEAQSQVLDNIIVSQSMAACGYFNPTTGDWVQPNPVSAKLILTHLRPETFGEKKTINVNHTNVEGLTLQEVEEKIKALELKNDIKTIDIDDDIEDADYESMDDDGEDNE